MFCLKASCNNQNIVKLNVFANASSAIFIGSGHQTLKTLNSPTGIPLLQNFFAVGPLTAQCELTSSLESVPVTLCCPDPDPYLTSCECSRMERCTFISFTTEPHVTFGKKAKNYAINE